MSRFLMCWCLNSNLTFLSKESKNVGVETEIQDQVAAGNEVASCPSPAEELNTQEKILA